MAKELRVELSSKDWAEIYYALDTKAKRIELGDYGPEDDPGDDAEWLGHLRQIMEKIGPDGREAAVRGVECDERA